MRNIYRNAVYLLLAGIFSGCASNAGPGVYGSVDQALASCNSGDNERWETNGYRTGIKPIVGTRQRDAQVVIDTGKVLKIWVAPYTQGNTLIAAHDIYTMVEQPHFVVGEMVPVAKGKGRSCDAGIPVSIKDKYLDTVSGAVPPRVPQTRLRGSHKPGKYDKTIKRYIK